MKKLVMKNTQFMKPPVTWVADEMGDLIDAVASYTNEENALGYSVYYYAKNMYEQPELRFMAVDGVTPGNKTIRSGEYPYVNEFYAAIRKDSPKDSGEYRLFQWLTQDSGQALIEGPGYVGIRETAAPFLTAGERSVEDGAVLHLGENHLIALDGMLSRGIPGTLLIYEDMAHMEFISNYAMAGRKYGLIDTTQPIIMYRATYDGKNSYGLRNLKEERWVIPPEYTYITQCENGFYKAWQEKTVNILTIKGRVF